MLSKSTTHQALTSKSLCQGKNHAFGLVSSKRYSAVFGTPDFVLKHRKYQYYWAFRTLTSPPLSSIPRTPREILRLFHTFIKHQYSNEFMCFSINTVLSSLCFWLGYFVFLLFELYLVLFLRFSSPSLITLLLRDFSICTAWNFSLLIIAGLLFSET